MSFDHTVEILAGATIHRCERLSNGGLDLYTDRGRVIVAGARKQIELECTKCGEFRLVEIVETAGKQQGVCAVCAHVWPIEKG